MYLRIYEYPSNKEKMRAAMDKLAAADLLDVDADIRLRV
jgi:hypothetical protein